MKAQNYRENSRVSFKNWKVFIILIIIVFLKITDYIEQIYLRAKITDIELEMRQNFVDKIYSIIMIIVSTNWKDETKD
jgi:hypothetical protein